MFTKTKAPKTTINHNKSYVGETIEQKIERIVTNQEPIKDGAPLIYTERKDGVKPEYDIRTDRFDIAVDAMDKVAATHLAKRQAPVVDINKGKDGGAESTGGTTGSNQP